MDEDLDLDLDEDLDFEKYLDLDKDLDLAFTRLERCCFPSASLISATEL